MKYLLTLFYLMLVSATFSCNKNSDECLNVSQTTIAINRSVIYIGSTLSLSANTTSSSYTFQWTGPGGWTSNQAIAVRSNIQASDGGDYSVKVYDAKNCLVFTAVKNIPVVPPPNPPCTVPNNTITTTKAGVGPYTFPGGVSAYINQSVYYYVAYVSAGIQIDFRFSGAHIPFAGIYKTMDYGVQEEDFVLVLFTYGTKSYRSKPGGELYVNNVAGKMVITFCNIIMYEFGTPYSEFSITGKLTPF